MISKLSTLMNGKGYVVKMLGVMGIIALVLSIIVLFPHQQVSASQQPPGGNVNAVGISIAGYKMPGGDIIPPAIATEGDVIQYKVTLSIPTMGPGLVGNWYEGGQLSVILPDGTVVHVAGYGGSTPDVPLVTDVLSFTVTVPQTYTVDLTDRVGGYLYAYAEYGSTGRMPGQANGIFHAGDDAPTASASTSHAFAPTTNQSLIIDKYNDLNGNGSWDVGEPYLSGWHFDVTGPQNFPDQVTDFNGQIILNDIATGDYTITETSLSSGWKHTDPGSPPYQKTATVSTEQTTEVKFGNQVMEHHPPSVPVIGTWGAALMAAVFAGSLIWVVALRRKRRTI